MPRSYNIKNRLNYSSPQTQQLQEIENLMQALLHMIGEVSFNELCRVLSSSLVHSALHTTSAFSLAECDNKTQAANLLSMKRTTLHEFMLHHKINVNKPYTKNRVLRNRLCRTCSHTFLAETFHDPCTCCGEINSRALKPWEEKTG